MLLQQLIEGLNREHLTAMLSHELGTYPESQLTSEAAEFLVDTVIRVKRTLHNRRVHRSIEIVKSRGQDYDPGEHTFSIHDGKGLEVFRRVQAPLPFNLEQPTSMARRSVIGVDALDALLGGGIFDGSTTMVVGLSGVGKTVLGTQILERGRSSRTSGDCWSRSTSTRRRSSAMPKRLVSICNRRSTPALSMCCSIALRN